VREEEREFLTALTPEFVHVFELNLIWNWRRDKMEVETDDAIHVQAPTGGGYLRGPVASIDFRPSDVECLH
jgi:hypothetical protein